MQILLNIYFIKKKSQINQQKQQNKLLLITGLPGSGKTLTILKTLNEFSDKNLLTYQKFNGMSYLT